jgi:hypothetical protein
MDGEEIMETGAPTPTAAAATCDLEVLRTCQLHQPGLNVQRFIALFEGVSGLGTHVLLHDPSDVSFPRRQVGVYHRVLKMACTHGMRCAVTVGETV